MLVKKDDARPSAIYTVKKHILPPIPFILAPCQASQGPRYPRFRSSALSIHTIPLPPPHVAPVLCRLSSTQVRHAIGPPGNASRVWTDPHVQAHPPLALVHAGPVEARRARARPRTDGTDPASPSEIQQTISLTNTVGHSPRPYRAPLPTAIPHTCPLTHTAHPSPHPYHKPAPSPIHQTCRLTHTPRCSPCA